MSLTKALLVYESRSRVYLTLHPIKDDVIGPGRPLSERSLDQLASKLASPAVFLGENVLYQGRNTVAWFEPAQTRVMFFNSGDDYLDRLSGRLFPQPPLVFVAAGNNLNVWALTSDERPRPDSPLAIAPYFNVRDGAMCRGSAALPERASPDNLELYSNAFWSSAFTHGTGSLLTKQWGGSYGQLWEHVAAEGRFPLGYLRDTNLTLKGAVCTR